MYPSDGTTPSGPVAPPKAEPSTVRLLDGREARLVPRDGGWSLEIDGVRQSHVDAPGSGPALTSVRWMLTALGPGPAIDCAHLGGGALSLPRALADARPGSTQVVVELEPALVDLVRDRFGLPSGTAVEIGDARRWVEGCEPGRWDAVTVDVFVGGRIPPPFTSTELHAAIGRALRPGGTVVVNSVAGPELEFTRRQLATVRSVFGHVGMVVQGSALNGARFGNATLIASDAALDADRIRSALAGDGTKGALLTGGRLDEVIGDAAPVTDADELWSPSPRSPRVAAALRTLDGVNRAVAQLRQARAALDDPPAPADPPA